MPKAGRATQKHRQSLPSTNSAQPSPLPSVWPNSSPNGRSLKYMSILVTKETLLQSMTTLVLGNKVPLKPGAVLAQALCFQLGDESLNMSVFILYEYYGCWEPNNNPQVLKGLHPLPPLPLPPSLSLSFSLKRTVFPSIMEKATPGICPSNS